MFQICRDGAWVENKGPLLTFHYRDTPNELRQELVDKARTIIESFGFNATESQCALEAKPPVQWNKGEQRQTRFELTDRIRQYFSVRF